MWSTKGRDVVKLSCFMGVFGFYFRKRFPRLTSNVYLWYLRRLTSGSDRRFIGEVMAQSRKIPLCIHVETVNYCNGECAFCPSNRYADERKPQKMSWDTLTKLFQELSSIDYDGILILNGNGEPFLDERMPRIVDEAARLLPRAQRIIHTNGTRLTVDILKQIAGKLDILYVNNYHTRCRLLPHNKRLYRYLKEHPEEFGGMKVRIEYRYRGEVLTNRSGNAPNKVNRTKKYKGVCPIPYMETSVYPDGSVGLCSNDCYEKNIVGNLGEAGLFDIYNGPELEAVREAMREGRDGFPFCQYCDFTSRSGRRKRWERTGRD